MMSIKQKLTGKPSIDRPWMQYYPQEMIENLTVPNSTIYEYLMYNCPGDDVVAIHYYGRDITWKQIKEETDKVARALKAVGFGENDEIPMFLRSVPEFIFLLLGAEKSELLYFVEIIQLKKMLQLSRKLEQNNFCS